MPIEIDHMDTTVELTGRPPETRGSAPAAPVAATAPASTSRAALRELVLDIMSDELEAFMRTRGF